MGQFERARACLLHFIMKSDLNWMHYMWVLYEKASESLNLQDPTKFTSLSHRSSNSFPLNRYPVLSTSFPWSDISIGRNQSTDLSFVISARRVFYGFRLGKLDKLLYSSKPRNLGSTTVQASTIFLRRSLGPR